MTIAAYLGIYLGFAIFVCASVYRAVQYARLPVHLRWDLYPVPHEEARRAAYGGSYFETTNWWTRPQKPNRIGELSVMVPEITFLKALWEFNRKLWYASYLFHGGLYITFGCAVLLILRALLAGASVHSPVFDITCRALGWVAVITTIAGSLALLWRRVRDPQLKNYTHRADLFNLIFFAMTYAVLGISFLTRPADASSTAAFVRGLLTFDTSVRVSAVLACGLLLASALLAYIPFTHMTHFIAKYFTYHTVRWDDRATVPGSDVAAKVQGYLAYKPTWSAPHVAADGKKTWAEIVTTNPPQEVRK